MSLLLDALKRAEQEKLAKQGGARPEDGNARRDTEVPPAAAPAAPAPARPASYELQPMAGSPSAPAAPAANSARAEAQAAQNVFNAKERPREDDNGGSKKGILIWSILVIVAIVIAGFGSYVWFQLQTFAPRNVAAALPRPITPAPPAPLPPATPSPSTAPGSTVTTVETLAPTQQPTSAIQPAPGAAAAAAAEPPRKPVLSDRPQDSVAELLRETGVPASSGAPLKLQPSREKPHVVPEVTRGYRELTEGDISGARRSYGAALVSDPTNLDALLGMATLEARGGNRYAAITYYGKALAVDPRNATAQAGLAAMEQDTDTDGIETHLRADLAQNPQSASLRFALGNVYAGQSRWGEAQVEYFEAFRLDPANADFTYNLAVALDHLHQERLAADYYARAIEASHHQATQFDPAVAARRLAQIKG